MKTIFAILYLLSSILAGHSLGFWDSLAMIETGGNDRAIGRVGEISRYQIRPEVWRAIHPALSRGAATNPRVALRVARIHLAALTREFRRASGRPASEVDCVILWKAGFAGYQARGFDPARMSAAHRDRVERFKNLRTLK